MAFLLFGIGMFRATHPLGRSSGMCLAHAHGKAFHDDFKLFSRIMRRKIKRRTARQDRARGFSGIFRLTPTRRLVYY
jgi:hypothetical protein